jgi:hypothetical protein
MGATRGPLSPTVGRASFRGSSVRARRLGWRNPRTVEVTTLRSAAMAAGAATRMAGGYAVVRARSGPTWAGRATSGAAAGGTSGIRGEGGCALLLVKAAWHGGTVRWPDLEEAVLLPILGGAPASIELARLSTELVSSAWGGATIFGSSGWPPSAPVVRWWLEVPAGGVEASNGLGCSKDVGTASPRWWAWREAPWCVVPRWASCSGD